MDRMVWTPTDVVVDTRVRAYLEQRDVRLFAGVAAPAPCL